MKATKVRWCTFAKLRQSIVLQRKFLSSEPNIVLNSRLLSTNRDDKPKYDVAVVGAGIVGMATARELTLRHPQLKLCVLDKEDTVAAHQSSHNSGVIHVGIYYTPGTLKAKLCVEGFQLAYKYCDENNVPYKKCGKLIVATTPLEVERLQVLYKRGLQNNVPELKLVGPDQIRDIEPYCKGLQAIHSPHTGIVDWGQVTKSYADNFRQRGGQIYLNYQVTSLKPSEDPDYPVVITGSIKNSGIQNVYSRYVITCAGLQSDRVATLSGCSNLPKIVPFRGEYLLLKPHKAYLVRGNIYPVPDPRFPFLGVHFTPRINGDVWLGPNAILAFKREGYRLTDLSPADMLDALKFRGLQRLVANNLGYAFGEFYKGINIAAQVKELQKFVPELTTGDVTRGPAGVRAQALGTDGKLIEDFIFDSAPGSFGQRTLHVRNAPSPAATSSLAIAKMISDKAKQQFEL